MNLNEIPYSVVITQEEYENNIDNLGKFCVGHDKEYILVEQNKNREIVHFTGKQNIESIRKYGLIASNETADESNFGKGVYALPTELKRVFENTDYVGILFNTNELEYYLCVDCRNSISPIGYIMFTENIPEEYIKGVYDKETVKEYYSEFESDVDELMYLCGIDWTDKENVGYLKIDGEPAYRIPYLLKTIRGD